MSLLLLFNSTQSRSVGIESAISVEEESLLQAQQFRFRFRFETVDSLSNVTDVTTSIYEVGIWHGEVAESVNGWSVSVAGTGYDRVKYAPGNTFRVYRTIWEGANTFAEELWYSGRILPETVKVSWTSQDFSFLAVDVLTYLARRRSNIIAAGEANAALNASTEADSYVAPELVADQGEFIGKPSLDPSRTVDNDMGTIWISGKAPTWEAALIRTDGPVSLQPIISEVYAWPHPSLVKKDYQWFEISTLGDEDGERVIRLMTRSGIIELNVTMGEGYGDTDPLPKFAVTCYDSSLLNSMWGSVPDHCPVYEWKNAPLPVDNPDDLGRVLGRNWGFNLDGEGDFLAISYGPQLTDPNSGNLAYGHNDYRWITMFVANGSRMEKIDHDGEYGAEVSDLVSDLKTTNSWLKDELAGCFVEANPYTGSERQVRYIVSNTASTGPSDGFYTTRVTLDRWWDQTNHPPGSEIIITPWPRAAGDDDFWADDTGYEAPDNLSSYKVKKYGDPLDEPGQDRWEIDTSPQIGYSGVTNDGLWSWVIVTPQPMEFALASPVVAGDLVLYLVTTYGMLEAGQLYIGLDGPYNYSARTAETVTLSVAYAGATLPAGTQVYQAIDSTVTLDWPIDTIRVKRRRIPTGNTNGSDTEYRVIQSIRVYGTPDSSPRPPGTPDEDGDWREDWDEIAFLDNNLTLSTIEWNALNNPYADPSWRYKKYCFAIRSMIDSSFGRINEITMLLSSDAVGNILTNVTVASFFDYILDLMGITTIDVSGCSTAQLSAFSTEPSSYLAILSDMAVRTGQIVVADRTGDVFVTRNPGWPSGPTLNVSTVLERYDIKNLTVQSRDDRAISQVQVQVRDSDGNISTGRYPPVPRIDGEVYREERIFSSHIGDADGIARWLFFEKVASTINVTTVGPALFARSGNQVVGISWRELTLADANGVAINRYWLIRGSEQVIRFGSRDVAASWETVLQLQDMRQWQ